jgi:uncharacterized membrane protein YjdF
MSVKSVSASAFTVDSPVLPAISKPGSQKLSRSEVLIAGGLVLAAYTALLVRMPHRAPLVNGLYTMLSLSSFYLYLRLRLDIRLPVRMILCLVVAVVLDIIGNQYNLFSRTFGFLPYDVITHFTASGLSLAAVMWLLLKLTSRFDYRLPLGFVAFFSVTTTFSLSAYYEILELVDEQFFGGHRIWTTHDTVHDLASDLGGIVLAAIIYTLVIRKRWRPGDSRFDQDS